MADKVDLVFETVALTKAQRDAIVSEVARIMGLRLGPQDKLSFRPWLQGAIGVGRVKSPNVKAAAPVAPDADYQAFMAWRAAQGAAPMASPAPAPAAGKPGRPRKAG